jgi:hypothetical protein
MESIDAKEKVDMVENDDCVGTTRIPSHQSGVDATDNTFLQQQQQQLDMIHRLLENDIYEENCINLSLLDPARYGWVALGGIADVSTPHEVRP